MLFRKLTCSAFIKISFQFLIHSLSAILVNDGEKNLQKSKKSGKKTYLAIFHNMMWYEHGDMNWSTFLAFSIWLTPYHNKNTLYWRTFVDNSEESWHFYAALTKSILRKVQIWGVFGPSFNILGILSMNMAPKVMIFWKFNL